VVKDGRCRGCVLIPAVIAILISGAWTTWRWMSSASGPGSSDVSPETAMTPGFASQPDREKLIAIFVPLWHEHSFTAGMVEHNVSAINYGNHHFFIGAYPNDDPTLDAVHELEQRFPHVHLAVCPHHGPTSKADCLNWVYQRMLLFEAHHGGQFEIVMTHDAEDLIHPESLA
jgi:adsorption protein B